MTENLSTVLDALLQAAYGPFKVGVAFAVYAFGRIATEQVRSRPGCHALMIGLAAVLGLLSFGGLGSHVEDADPLFGGGDVVQDREPTDAERLESSVKVFVMAGTLLILGATQGFRQGVR